MALRYCFEQEYVARTLAKSKLHDLAVVDTEGCESAVRAAVKRGVWVYGYINIGSLERERPYYNSLKNLRLAPYEGWDGEYWIDVTAQAWKDHIKMLAKQLKATGTIGVYLDNTDVYYIVSKGIKNPMKSVPSKTAVYNVLAEMVLYIQQEVGLIVMPNGGDVFVKRFITKHPGIIQTINQEGLFYEDFKKQSKEETEYRKNWCKWAQKHISGKVRIIDYCKKPAEIAKVKAYCFAHGWDCYISKHKNLEGD